ncbi:unnamed protein product [Symbiodinium sp. CCMP2592]|nr:unnamed protein product [Symbiodinium sp. CCMP2592]
MGCKVAKPHSQNKAAQAVAFIPIDMVPTVESNVSTDDVGDGAEDFEHIEQVAEEDLIIRVPGDVSRIPGVGTPISTMAETLPIRVKDASSILTMNAAQSGFCRCCADYLKHLRPKRSNTSVGAMGCQSSKGAVQPKRSCL